MGRRRQRRRQSLGIMRPRTARNTAIGMRHGGTGAGRHTRKGMEMEMDRLPIIGQKQNENDTENSCTLSEAKELISFLLASYPSQKLSDYEGTVAMYAEVMVKYPFEIAQMAVKPTGIPTDHPTYLPNVGFLSNWLSRKMAIMRQKPVGKSYPAAAPTRKKGQYTYGEFLKMVEEGKVKSGRPIGRFEKAGDRWNERIKDDSAS